MQVLCSHCCGPRWIKRAAGLFAGSTVEKADGDRKETKAEKAERRQREAAAYDPKRFARRFKRRRRINWIGSIVSLHLRMWLGGPGHPAALPWPGLCLRMAAVHLLRCQHIPLQN